MKLGTKIIFVDRYFPSSQLCSVCGYKNTAVKDLKIREWDCPHCHTHHDRDKNAAINIHMTGTYLRVLARPTIGGEPVPYGVLRDKTLARAHGLLIPESPAFTRGEYVKHSRYAIALTAHAVKYFAPIL